MDYSLPVVDKWQVGTFVKTTSPHIIEILGNSGLDFAVLDAEHAPFERSSIDMAMIAGRSVGLPLFVRVPEKNASSMLSALDMGAAGVLVPHVDTVKDAEEIVSYCKYIGGQRGYSSSPRAAGYGTRSMKDVIRRGDSCCVIAQIESVEAVNNAAEIASIDGIDGIFIGRADLALSMGLDSSQDPLVNEAAEKAVKCAISAGKIAGMVVGSNEERKKYLDLGVSWFVQSSDQSMLLQAAKSISIRK